MVHILYIDQNRHALGRVFNDAHKILSLQAEFFDDTVILAGIGLAKIVQKFLPLCNHAQESPPGMVVFGVFFQMTGQLGDFLGEYGNLDLRRAGVSGVALKRPDDFWRETLHYGALLDGTTRPVNSPLSFERGLAVMEILKKSYGSGTR